MSPSQDVVTAEDEEEDCPVELPCDPVLDAPEDWELFVELVDDCLLLEEKFTHELTGDTMTCSSCGAHTSPGVRRSSKIFGALQFHAPK